MKFSVSLFTNLFLYIFLNFVVLFFFRFCSFSRCNFCAFSQYKMFHISCSLPSVFLMNLCDTLVSLCLLFVLFICLFIFECLLSCSFFFRFSLGFHPNCFQCLCFFVFFSHLVHLWSGWLPWVDKVTSRTTLEKSEKTVNMTHAPPKTFPVRAVVWTFLGRVKHQTIVIRRRPKSRDKWPFMTHAPPRSQPDGTRVWCADCIRVMHFWTYVKQFTKIFLLTSGSIHVVYHITFHTFYSMTA